MRAVLVLLLVGGCAVPLAAQESRDAPLYAGRPLVDVLHDLNRGACASSSARAWCL